jgi:tagatose 6-phosphate kinase
MITVAGFNTAIDRFIQVDALTPGEVHRARSEKTYPGGKGVHVAQTIAALGESVQLVGVIDAAHRPFVAQRMSARGVLFHGVEIAGPLRQCVAVQDAGGGITEILGQGPLLDAGEQQRLLQQFRRSVDESALVIVSGSVPRGFPDRLYAELIGHVHRSGKRCLVDASGEALRHAVSARPFLIKPNRDEVSALAGHPVIDVRAAQRAAVALHERGIAMPVVTMGALGAIAADDSGVWHAHIQSVPVRNTVGSGDCLLAGMAVALHRGMPLAQALRLGVACGAANAASEETGFAERGDIDALLAGVNVERLPSASS